MSYHIKLEGCFKPYVRMTQRGKFVRRQAQEYLASKDALKLQLTQEMIDREMLPDRTPLKVFFLIGHDHGFHNRDLDNEVKALLDAMQGIVFRNDCWIDEIKAIRLASSRCVVSVFVEVRRSDGTNRNRNT